VLFRELGLSKVLRWAHLGLLDTQQAITMKVRGWRVVQQLPLQQQCCSRGVDVHRPHRNSNGAAKG
jgi:hypothetical protein